MAYNFSYAYNIDLEQYIAVHIEPDGELEVLYNGPGRYINKFLKDIKRKSYLNMWTTITANHLRELNSKLKESERLPEITAKKKEL
jgi:acylphosphatase